MSGEIGGKEYLHWMSYGGSYYLLAFGEEVGGILKGEWE